jgi:hypothetical protein
MQKRRDFVFNELHRLVCEFDDAVSDSRIESAWDVDHELGAMLIRLNIETRCVRKLQKPVQTEAA